MVIARRCVVLAITRNERTYMSSETQKTMVRFDFPPGATAKEIAEALKKAYAEIMAKKHAALARADGETTTPPEGNSSST
jgi:uncharacterized protein (UPF0218 family)